MQLKNTTALAGMQRLNTQPVRHPRTMRPDVVRTVTSGNAGLAQPLAFFPLEREDAMETTRARCTAYMDETADLILNTVYCTFTAWFVPRLAFDRFDKSMDSLNRANMKKAERDGVTLDFIASAPYDGGTASPLPLYVAAGLHAGAVTDNVSTDNVEAYDKIFEYRCRTRSEALWEAVQGDATISGGNLAPAFFDNPQMSIVKPSFDSAALEGEVPLTSTTGPLDVRMAGTQGGIGGAVSMGIVLDEPNDGYLASVTGIVNKVYAELDTQGITLSLANIEMAKKTQAWAEVRTTYDGLDDDELIDLLMSGVAVPTEYAAQPMLIDRKTVPFGMTQRYSTEAANLDVSATRGVASSEMTLRVPQTNTGGVVVVLAEVVPEQFWERSKDYLFLRDNDTRRPDRLIDQLDPQAVEVVDNDHFDIKHADPTGVGGYAPLNHGHVRTRFNLGGKFFKDDPLATWTEDRNRIWVSEPVDPQLSRQFYLAEDLPREVFMQQITDNFEFSFAADARISGMTFIGPALKEAFGDYDAILNRVDKSRIAGTPVAQVAGAQAAGSELQPEGEPSDLTEQPEGEPAETDEVTE